MKSEKITVYVNGKPKKIFFGMRVKDAIGVRRARAAREHRAVVRDAEGNRIDVDGALYDGERLFISPQDPEAFADEMQKRADAAFR
ncbi:MAG TPA: hypothetical protein VF478_01895, partial [Anaerolineae bacterium]